MSTSKFVKQVLVEQGELDHLRQRQIRDYSPEIRSMTLLQEEMLRTMMRPDLDAQQKLDLISGPTMRFNHLKAITNTLSGSSAAQPSAPVAVTKQVEDKKEEKKEVKTEPVAVSLDSATDTIAKSYKKKALDLMEKFSANPQVIARNADGELVVNGQAVPGSDFNKLYKTMFTGNGSATMTGMPELLGAMRQLQVSSAEVVSVPVKKAMSAAPARTLDKHELTLPKEEPDPENEGAKRSKSSKKKLSNKNSQTGQGLPPGTRPRILYVY